VGWISASPSYRRSPVVALLFSRILYAPRSVEMRGGRDASDDSCMHKEVRCSCSNKHSETGAIRMHDGGVMLQCPCAK